MSAGFYKIKTASTPKTNAPSPSITISSIEATSSLKIRNKGRRHNYGSSSLSGPKESKERSLPENTKKSTKKRRRDFITPDERREQKRKTKRHESKRKVRRQIESSSSSERNWQTTREKTLSSDENDRRNKSIESVQTENIFDDNSEWENFPHYRWEKPPETVRDAPKNADSVQNVLQESFDLISNRRSGRTSFGASNDGKFDDSDDDSILAVADHERIYPAPKRSSFFRVKSKLTMREQIECIRKYHEIYGVVNSSGDERRLRNRELMMKVRNAPEERVDRSAKRSNRSGKSQPPACEMTTTHVRIAKKKRPIYDRVSPITKADGTSEIYDVKNERDWPVRQFRGPLAIPIERPNRHNRKYYRGNNEPEARSVSMKSIDAASGSRSKDRVSGKGSLVEKRIARSDRHRRREALRRNDESSSSEESDGERSKQQFYRSGRKIDRAKTIARSGEIVRASRRKERSDNEDFIDIFDSPRLKGSYLVESDREESSMSRDRSESRSKRGEDLFRYSRAKIDVDSDWTMDDFLTRPLKRRRANNFHLFPLQSSSGYPVEKIPNPTRYEKAFDEESIDASKSREKWKKMSALERASGVVKKHRRVARLIYSDSGSSPEVSPKIVGKRSESSEEKSRDSRTLSSSTENIPNDSDNSIGVRQSDRTDNDPEVFSSDRSFPFREAPNDNDTLDTILEERSFRFRNTRRKPLKSHGNSSSFNRSRSSVNHSTIRSSRIFSDPVAVKCAPDRWKVFSGKITGEASTSDD